MLQSEAGWSNQEILCVSSVLFCKNRKRGTLPLRRVLVADGNGGHAVVHLRDATSDDAAQAAELLHIAQGKASVPIHGLGDRDWALKFYRWMFRQSGTFWSYDITKVAVEDAEIIGLVAFYPNEKERTYRTTCNNAAITKFYGTEHWERLIEYSRRYDAYRDGTPAVSARCGIYVINLAVAPAQRCRGIANRLLEAADQTRI